MDRERAGVVLNFVKIIVLLAAMVIIASFFMGCAPMYEMRTYQETETVIKNGKEVQQIKKEIIATQPSYSNSGPMYFSGWVAGRSGYASYYSGPGYVGYGGIADSYRAMPHWWQSGSWWRRGR